MDGVLGHDSGQMWWNLLWIMPLVQDRSPTSSCNISCVPTVWRGLFKSCNYAKCCKWLCKMWHWPFIHDVFSDNYSHSSVSKMQDQQNASESQTIRVAMVFNNHLQHWVMKMELMKVLFVPHSQLQYQTLPVFQWTKCHSWPTASCGNKHRNNFKSSTVDYGVKQCT